MVDKVKSLVNDLTRKFKDKKIQLIDWSHLSENNSIIIMVGESVEESNSSTIPQQICIEISLGKPLFITYKQERREKTYLQHNGSLGFSQPIISEIIHPINVEIEENLVKCFLKHFPDYSKQNIESDSIDIQNYSSIFLKYFFDA